MKFAKDHDYPEDAVLMQKVNVNGKNADENWKLLKAAFNNKDVFSVVKGSLYFWPHLHAGNGARICDFVISRRFCIHQNHANIFLNLYYPKLRRRL